jgi:hypothetical protein
VRGVEGANQRRPNPGTRVKARTTRDQQKYLALEILEM